VTAKPSARPSARLVCQSSRRAGGALLSTAILGFAVSEVAGRFRHHTAASSMPTFKPSKTCSPVRPIRILGVVVHPSDAQCDLPTEAGDWHSSADRQSARRRVR